MPRLRRPGVEPGSYGWEPQMITATLAAREADGQKEATPGRFELPREYSQ